MWNGYYQQRRKGRKMRGTLVRVIESITELNDITSHGKMVEQEVSKESSNNLYVISASTVLSVIGSSHYLKVTTIVFG